MKIAESPVPNVTFDNQHPGPGHTRVELLAGLGGACSEAGCVVIEPGSGSSKNVRLLLDAVAPAAYAPIDISADFLLGAALKLGRVSNCATAGIDDDALFGVLSLEPQAGR
jgi:hypothetical protein